MVEEPTLKLEDEEPTLKLEDEEPLILEEVHQEPVVQKREKKISPAARKMAMETNVDLSEVEGSGKKWHCIKRRYYGFDGFKTSSI